MPSGAGAAGARAGLKLWRACPARRQRLPWRGWAAAGHTQQREDASCTCSGPHPPLCQRQARAFWLCVL